MRLTGIYKITNTVTGQVYIGLSRDCPARMSKHKCDLRKNRHRNQHLQNSWNKYGEAIFSFRVELECPADELASHEMRLIAESQSYKPDLGFNNSMGGENNPPTEETRKRISESAKKRAPPSEETCRKISDAKKGKPVSEEVRLRLITMGKGRKKTDEERQRRSESLRGNTNGKGTKRTEEQKKAMSEVKMGNKNSAGRKMSPEHYAALIGANVGKPRSEETKAKISATRLLRYGRTTASLLPGAPDEPEDL